MSHRAPCMLLLLQQCFRARKPYPLKKHNSSVDVCGYITAGRPVSTTIDFHVKVKMVGSGFLS